MANLTLTSMLLFAGISARGQTNQPAGVYQQPPPLPQNKLLGPSGDLPPMLKPRIVQYDSYLMATGGPHVVYFNPSLEAPDAVRIRLPDESVLQARVAAISLIDKSGRRTWLANLKASQAELSSDDTTRLWCRDAFDGLRADIRYSYGLGFFEQDVTLREQVALPDGMDLGSAKMEIWTEVFDFPNFQLTQKSIQLRRGPRQYGINK